MSSETTSARGKPTAGRGQAEDLYTRIYVWQWPIRLFHWTNAAAVTTLFVTGLLIAFPSLTSTGEPWEVLTVAKIRKIHFIAAFVFLIGFCWRVFWFYMGNRYARSGMPRPWRKAWWSDLFEQAWHYLSLEFGTPHAGHNSLAGLSYTIFVIALGWFQIFTGFAMYSENQPDGLWAGLTGWVLPLLGGSARVHALHHLGAWLFLVFVILHLYIVFLDARQYRNGLIVSMITGFKFKRTRKADSGPASGHGPGKDELKE